MNYLLPSGSTVSARIRARPLAGSGDGLRARAAQRAGRGEGVARAERLSGLAGAVPPMQPGDSVWRGWKSAVLLRLLARPLQWLSGVLSSARSRRSGGALLCVAAALSPGLIAWSRKAIRCRKATWVS